MKDLGNKFTCYKCQTKFYDMKKPAPICPKCGADQREMPVQTKSERKKAAAVPAPSRLEAVEDHEEKAPEDEEEEDEQDEVEEDEDG